MMVLLLLAVLVMPCLADPPLKVEPASLKTQAMLQVTEDVFYPDAAGTRTFHHRTRVLAARPNQFRIDTLDVPGDPYAGSVTACDGKTVMVYDSRAGTVTRSAFHLHAGYGIDEEITEGYFPMPVKTAKLEGRDVLYAGLDGSEPVPATTGGKPQSSPVRMEWWFDPQTLLPLRSIDYRTVGGKLREVYRKDYSDWVADKPIDPAALAFTPPAGAKEAPAHE